MIFSKNACGKPDTNYKSLKPHHRMGQGQDKIKRKTKTKTKTKISKKHTNNQFLLNNNKNANYVENGFIDRIQQENSN